MDERREDLRAIEQTVRNLIVDFEANHGDEVTDVRLIHQYKVDGSFHLISVEMDVKYGRGL